MSENKSQRDVIFIEFYQFVCEKAPSERYITAIELY